MLPRQLRQGGRPSALPPEVYGVDVAARRPRNQSSCFCKSWVTKEYSLGLQALLRCKLVVARVLLLTLFSYCRPKLKNHEEPAKFRLLQLLMMYFCVRGRNQWQFLEGHSFGEMDPPKFSPLPYNTMSLKPRVGDDLL